jgi:hypothetical protein
MNTKLSPEAQELFDGILEIIRRKAMPEMGAEDWRESATDLIEKGMLAIYETGDGFEMRPTPSGKREALAALRAETKH